VQIRYFAHSWLSDWNHGNAHFLRGLASALVRRGHALRLYEPMPTPAGGWSLAQLRQEPNGRAAIAQVRAAYPELDLRCYGPGALGPERVLHWDDELRGADLVLVHEWSAPELLHWLLLQRRRFGFRLLWHDTHHRAASQPHLLQRLPLASLDGVVAFGESLRRLYEGWGVRRSFTFHEAADTERFFPLAPAPQSALVWIGNWGDGERTRELHEFLLGPVRAARLSARAYGVRYPPAARAQLAALGIAYAGYLPNLQAPRAYAAAQFTLHLPRAPYAHALPGIPTIRMFEAMACGVPLLCSPWDDTEALFQSGADYWPARDGREMTALMMQLLRHEEQRIQLGRHAAATIRARHTCAHRAQQLEAICRDLD